MRLLLALLLLIAPPAAADWRAATWGAAVEDAPAGETAQEISLAYGAGLNARLLGEEELGGLRFRALWQFDEAGLRQVLLRRRGAQAGNAAVRQTLEALRAEHGPPAESCPTPNGDGWRTRWDLPGGVLHLGVFVGGGGLAGFDRTVADLLTPVPRQSPPGAAPLPRSLHGTSLDRRAENARLAQDRAASARGESPPGTKGGVHRRAVAATLTLRWRDPAAARLAGDGC